MKSPAHSPLFGALLGLLLCLPPQVTAAEDDADAAWEKITHEAGILVQQRSEPGREMPTFRGTMTVDAPLYEILAVLIDTRRHQEWMHHCVDSRELHVYSDTRRVVYNRTEALWPVWDRDMVLETWMEAKPAASEVWARVRAIPGAEFLETPEGVVRITDLNAYYRLTWLEPERTKVVYQVDADPGGSLPKWIARLASRSLPLETLRNLRAQVSQSGSTYREFLHKWDPRHGGRGFAGLAPRTAMAAKP